MRPGEQGWLLAGSAGNHEYSRVFYQATREKPEPHYVVREGTGRLGGIELQHVSVDDRGAWLTWTKGFRTHLPPSLYQLTYQV